MTPRPPLPELLAFVSARGIRLLARGDKLCVKAKTELMTPELLDLLNRYKSPLMAMLRGEGNCSPHNNPTRFRFEPDRYGRSGWRTAYCRVCGRFVGYLDRNPFDGVKRGVPAKNCNVFVAPAVCERVLAEIPDGQLRLLFALSRWGGLRTPSEQRRLRWCDIDWEKDRFLVHSSKTEHHVGHETRWVPIFPELAPILAERFEDASDGDELVLPMMQSFTDSAFSHRITRLMDRIGVERWARLFHSMRSTRQTELERVWPTHVVCYWLGNSTMIARRHYLMTTDEDFAKAAHNPTQQVPAEGGTERKTDSTPIEKSPVLHGRA